jgi:hypothetical protein
LWILQTGAAWRFLPDEFPSPSTCWRRLKQWEDEGVWLNASRALLGALDQEGLLKWDEAFLDGSFAPAKKGALPSGKPSDRQVSVTPFAELSRASAIRIVTAVTRPTMVASSGYRICLAWPRDRGVGTRIN